MHVATQLKCYAGPQHVGRFDTRGTSRVHGSCNADKVRIAQRYPSGFEEKRQKYQNKGVSDAIERHVSVNIFN